MNKFNYKYFFTKDFIFWGLLLLIPIIVFPGCGWFINKKGSVHITEIPIPSWITHRMDPRYPNDSYLIGIGMSEKESADADKSARADLIKLIKAEFSDNEIFFRKQKNQKPYTYRTIEQASIIESNIKSKCEMIIDDLIINDRWFDEKGNRHYSLATLKINPALEKMANKIASEIDTINKLFLSGLKQEKNKGIVMALNSYKMAYVKRIELEISFHIYRAIRKDAEKDAGASESNIQNMPPSLFSISERLERLISGIDVIVVEGDDQKGVPECPLPKPLSAKVLFKQKDGDKSYQYPIADIPMEFIFDLSGGELDTFITTDTNGIARSRVYLVDASENKTNTISAHIALKDFPELKNKKAVFHYSLTQQIYGDLKGYTWHEGITKLIYEMISNINDDRIVKVAVLNFWELRSGMRLSISKNLELDLRKILSKVEDLVVVGMAPEELKDDMPDMQKQAIALKADYYITGLYWLHNNGLQINAKFIQTNSKILTTTAEITILKDSINNDDLNQILSIHELYNFDLPYEVLVDKIYLQKEEKPAFNLKIWTDKKEYIIGNAMTIYVKSDKDCYLYLFYIGTDGKISLLFPNFIQKSNFINGAGVISIPHDYKGPEMNLTGPPGIGRVKAIAFPRPSVPFDKSLFLDNEYSGKKNINELLDVLNKKGKYSLTTWVQDYTDFRICSQITNLPHKKRSIKVIKTPDKPQIPIDIIGTQD